MADIIIQTPQEDWWQARSIDGCEEERWMAFVEASSTQEKILVHYKEKNISSAVEKADRLPEPCGQRQHPREKMSPSRQPRPDALRWAPDADPPSKFEGMSDKPSSTGVLWSECQYPPKISKS